MRTLTSLELQQIGGGELSDFDRSAFRFEPIYQSFRKLLSDNKDLEELYPLLVGAFVVGTLFGAVLLASQDEK